MAARVIPQHTRPQRPVICPDQRRTVHMPGQPQTRDGAAIGLCGKGAQGRHRRIAPRLRVLFGPAIMGARHRQRHRMFRHDVLRVIHQDRLERRGAQIKTDKAHAATFGFLPRMIIDKMSSSVTSSTRSVPTIWPFFITATRSQSSIISRVSWLIRKMPKPCFFSS